MHAWHVAFVLAGCGRIGFDEPEAVPRIPDLCGVKTVGTITFGGAGGGVDPEVATAVRAVPLANGFAAVVGTDLDNIYAIRVDANLDLVSQHVPLTGGYVLRGAGQIDDNLFIYADFGIDAYLKALDPSWDSYTTAQGVNKASIDPPFALLPDPATAMFAGIAGGTLTLSKIDTAGFSTGITGDINPAATSASLASVPGAARLVYESGDGTCKTVVVRPDGTTHSAHVIPMCSAPHVVGLPDGTGAVLHTPSPVNSTLSLHLIPSTSTSAGTPLAITGTEARLAKIDDEPWVAHRGTKVSLTRVGVDETESREVPVVVGPFDLAATVMFWVDGTALRAARPCTSP